MTAPAPAAWPREDVRPLTQREFGLFRELIHREAGICLSPAKKALLVGRLSRRLRELGLRSFGDYYARVSGPENERERVLMLERMCTHETRFFREPRQFEFLESRVVPEWEALAAAGRRTRSVRVWSAGCSTGQEPYSLAMLLLSHLPPHSGWRVQIVATDLSTRALAKAKEARWPVERAQEIPLPYRRRFMLRGIGAREGCMKARPELRAAVRFGTLNLNDRHYGPLPSFDLIFCRNVLIYFSSESRKRAIERMIRHLAPGGHLLLGHAESLNHVTDQLRSVGPMAYRRTAELGKPDRSRVLPPRDAQHDPTPCP